MRVRRLAAAKQVVTDFGVATECGFGRRPPETVPGLIDLHFEVAGAGLDVNVPEPAEIYPRRNQILKTQFNIRWR